MARPSVFPTGVTIYDKNKAYGGYTLFPSYKGGTLVDMNGRVVKIWEGMNKSPIKMLPGGFLMGSIGEVPGNSPGATDYLNTIQVDWEGNVVWCYNKNEKLRLADGSEVWASRQHHDFQREGSDVGYYAPGREPLTDRGNTILLTHHNVTVPAISDQELIDEKIIEVTWEGKTVWEWKSCEHFDEMGFDEDARKAIYRHPHRGDWIHFNAVNTLGENRFYDAGDTRFAPENLICSSANANLLLIIEKKTGKIVWRVGPDYSATPELKALGPFIFQHFVHMIPKGLPGAGNILVFDNGNANGYGKPHASAPEGTGVYLRSYSRVVEFDPVTLEIKWEYMKANRSPGGVLGLWAHQFYSPFISSAQRLPNGNTLITEGADGVLIEVTPEKEIVWEFINPLPSGDGLNKNSIYRAYRIPYEWVPQLKKSEEVSVVPPKNEDYRVPGSFPLGDTDSVTVKICI